MTWLKWIKAAASIGTGGMSSLYLYGGLLVAGMAFAGGAFVWHETKVEAVRFKAFKAGNDEVQAEWDKAVAEQKAQSDEQVNKWKGQANEVDAKNQELSERLDAANKRNASLVDRMRKSTPSAKQLASATPEACGEYAADAERSVDYCADSVKRLGETAVGASQKAWEFHDKWPAYQEFESKLKLFQSQLKGQL